MPPRCPFLHGVASSNKSAAKMAAELVLRGEDDGIPNFALRVKSRAPTKASTPKCYKRAAGMFALRISTSSVRIPASAPGMKRPPLPRVLQLRGGDDGIRTHDPHVAKEFFWVSTWVYMGLDVRKLVLRESP